MTTADEDDQIRELLGNHQIPRKCWSYTLDAFGLGDAKDHIAGAGYDTAEPDYRGLLLYREPGVVRAQRYDLAWWTLCKTLVLAGLPGAFCQARDLSRMMMDLPFERIAGEIGGPMLMLTNVYFPLPQNESPWTAAELDDMLAFLQWWWGQGHGVVPYINGDQSSAVDWLGEELMTLIEGECHSWMVSD